MIEVPNPAGSANEKWQPTRWGVDAKTDRLRQLLLAEGVEEGLALGFSLAMYERMQVKSYERRELLEEFSRWANTHTHEFTSTPSEDPYWETLNAPSSAKYGPAFGWVSGLGLVVAGGRVSGGSVSTDVYVFDGTTYTPKTSLSAGFYYPSCAVIDGILYAAGGQNSSGAVIDTLNIYDPSTDSWTTGTPMPSTVTQGVGVTDGAYLYCIGGDGFNHYRYDPLTDTWTSLSDLSLMRGLAGACYDGAGGILIFGGFHPTALTVYPSSTRYDIATDTYSGLDLIPEGVGRYGQAVQRLSTGKILVAGGATEVPSGSHTSLDAAYFDPLLDEWDTSAPDHLFDHWVPAHGLTDEGNVLVVGGLSATAELFYPVP